MLRNKDLYEEIERIEKLIETVNDPLQKAKLKIGTLTLKLLHNVRTNLVSLMEVSGAKKVEIQTDEKLNAKPTTEKKGK